MPGSAPRVLVADDDASLVQTLTWILKENGYEVAVCPGGDGLFAKLEEIKPAILLLDIMMPKVDGLQLLDDFERDGRLARHDVGMIERRHDRELLRAGDLLRLDAPILRRASREYDLAAPLLHACDFYRGRRFWHDDHRAHAELLRGICDGLAVVPRRIGDDATLARRVRKFADGVVGAADLERADRLFVLELEMRAQLLDVDEPCAARDPPQTVCGVLDIPGSDHLTSWASS